MLVDLAVFLYLVILLLLKLCELVEEHGEAHIVLKVHEDFEDVYDLVLDLHDYQIVGCPLVPLFYRLSISEKWYARVTSLLDLPLVLLLFVLRMEIELTIN